MHTFRHASLRRSIFRCTLSLFVAAVFGAGEQSGNAQVDDRPPAIAPGEEQPISVLQTLRQTAEEAQKYSPEEIYEKLLPSTAFVMSTVLDNEVVVRAFGSGWLVDRERRLLVTNEHVVRDKRGFDVYFADRDAAGDVITATKHYLAEKARLAIHGKVVARDIQRDLALIQLDRVPDDAQALALAPKSAVPGQSVFSIGCSGAHLEQIEIGALWRYTTGQVRVLRRLQMHVEGGFRDTTALETTSPTNHGDSGGPMVNDRMQLVAVVAGTAPDDQLASYNIDVNPLRAFLQDYRDGKPTDDAVVADEDKPQPGDVPKPDGSKPAPLKVQPGYVIGRVSGFDGKPITGALGINIGYKSTNLQLYNVAVKPDGTYSQRLAPGDYRVDMSYAMMQMDGKTFKMPLDPVGDLWSADREAEAGIVQDFTLRIQGLKPLRTPDQSVPGHYYGGAIKLGYDIVRTDLRTAVPAVPVGTKLVITFTPKGKLIDGSEGKAYSAFRTVEPRGFLDFDGLIVDIPFGLYTLTGEQIMPDGTKVKLLFRKAYATYVEAYDLTFQPGVADIPQTTIVNVSRDP